MLIHIYLHHLYAIYCVFKAERQHIWQWMAQIYLTHGEIYKNLKPFLKLE